MLLSGQGRKNRVLYAVGVLILVHQDLPVESADLRRCCRGACPEFTQQQIQGLMLQIAEIQTTAAFFRAAVGFVKLPDQSNQSPGSRRRLGQIHQQLGGIVRKAAKLSFQPLFAGISGGLDPLRQFRIRIFPGKCQAAVVDFPAVNHFIPGFTSPQGFQLIQRIPQIDGGFFHPFTAVCAGSALLQDTDLAVQIIEQILHQIVPPDRLRGIADSFRVCAAEAAVQPPLRIQMTSGAVVDLFDDLRHQPVIPAKALGIHKGPEIRILPRVFIGLIQQFRQNRLPDLPAFIFIRHPEICGKIQFIGIFPQKVAAEAVNCGDFCQKQPLHLLLQVAVFRILGDTLRQFGCDLAPQF